MAVAVGNRPPRGLLLPVLVGLIALAWIMLWWLEQSSYAWLFHAHGTAGHTHRAPMAGWLVNAAFLAGWLLMTVAMMLPTTVPLSILFRRLIRERTNAGRLIALLIAGYLCAWLLFGVAALGVVRGLESAMASVSWLQTNAWVTGAGLFLIAGAFQFSSLKYACLERCRAPAGFLMSYWHGRNERLESFNIGWRHGIFCVGCCWALMMLMFVFATVSIAWMLVLALLMALEKNTPWGSQMSRPAGLVFVSIGLTVTIYNLAI